MPAALRLNLTRKGSAGLAFPFVDLADIAKLEAAVPRYRNAFLDLASGGDELFAAGKLGELEDRLGGARRAAGVSRISARRLVRR